MESNRKIISYIATSLDGKIARLDGGVDWLDEVPNPDKSDYGYGQFYGSIDTTIMGMSTYQEILNMGVDFPYTGKKNYVFTRDQSKTQDEHVSFITDNIDQFISELRNENDKDIWLIGGGQMNTLFIKNGWLDELRVFIMPIAIGEGLPLFGSKMDDKHLKLIETVNYASGVVQLKYQANYEQ